MTLHTQGPWKVSAYDEYLGYDCMTGGVRAGPVVLDGKDYGQDHGERISEQDLAVMMADANLIAAAPELLAALRQIKCLAPPGTLFRVDAEAAISKAMGGTLEHS